MSTIILAVALLATMHFVYEGIVLPSIRMRLRDTLFRLRDELRRVWIDQPTKCNSQVFLFLDVNICHFLSDLSLLTFALAYDTEKCMANNPKLKSQVEQRLRAVESCDCEEFRRIYHEVNRVLTYALLANSGAWFIYLVPVGLAVCCFSRLAKAVKELMMMPPKQSQMILSHQVSIA